MSGESQKWNNAVQIGFGDEISQEALNDYWPSSTHSPGPSPQPSPDSQLLEPPPVSSEASALSQANLKSSANQSIQTPVYSCQQSSLVSQSNLPQHKQSTGHSLQSQSSSTTSSPQIESQGGVKAKNAFQSSNPSSQPASRPPPPSFQTSPQKSQNALANQNVSQNTNMHYQQYNLGGPVRPSSAGQHSIRLQTPGSAQESRQTMKGPSPSQAPVGNQGPPHPRMSQPRTQTVPSGNQQQQHFQPQAGPVRQPQFAGQQRQNVPPGHVSNPNLAPRTMSHNQYMPSGRPQLGHGPPSPRLSPPGQPPNPRFRMGQHPPPGRMVRPPHPANVGPRMAGPRMAGGPRYPSQGPNQVRLPPQSMQHHALEHGPYPDFDEDDDEEDMYYDEDEDEDEFDEMYGEMPYGQEYDSDGSMSSSSDEDHMMLKEYVECDDDARAEYLYEQLKARGVPPEEIEDFKENYVRQRNYDDLDYDEEMEDDEDEDEYLDEEMVSSSTTMNNNLGGMQHSMQAPRYPSQSGTGVRPTKDAMPQSCSSPSSSSSFRHPPQGIQSGPRPQGPRGPPPQRFPTPPQRKQGPVHPMSSGSTPLQGSQIPPRPPQPRLPSPVKSQNSGQTFQGLNNQKQGSILPQSSPSSAEVQNFHPRHSAPLQQTSSTGPSNVRAPTPHPSAPQIPSAATPSTSQAQHSNSNMDHVSNTQGQLPSTRPPPSQPGQAMNSAQAEGGNYGIGQSGSFSMRPVHPRPSAPRQPNRFAPPHAMGGQTNTATFHGNPRMATAISSPRLKATLLGGKVPSEAHLARMAVLEMQKSLDKEIMAKKRVPPSNNPSSQQRQTFVPPNVHGVHHQHAGRPRLQNPAMVGSSQFVRHQLPPRTPFPRTHGPRPTRVQTARPVCSVPPFTSHSPQPAAPPNPRPPNQGGVGNIPRPQNAPPSQHSVNPAQPHTIPNRLNSPLNVQQSVAMSPVAGGNPSPRNTTPCQVTNQPEASFDQSKQAEVQESGQNQPQTQSGQHVQQPQQQQQQHSQQAPCKSESFNLCSLSEDNFIVKGKQRLVTNTVYQIKSPVDQTSKLARWNGERFEDLEPYGEKPVSSQTKNPPNQPAPQAPGSTPVTQTTSTQGPVNQPQTSRSDNAVNKDSGVSQSTYVKPMAEENKSPLSKPNPPVDENEDDFIFKKPLNENEEHFRVCNYCGYTSKNFKQCEGCKRIFQGTAKIHVQKKKKSVVTASSASTSIARGAASGEPFTLKKTQSEEDNPDAHKEIMANVDFYGTRKGRGRPPRGGQGRTRGGGMKSRTVGRKGPDDYDSSDSEDSVDKQSSDASADGPVKRKVGRGRSRNSAPRKKSKKIDEPVTVMISSDEDEPSSTSNMPQGSGPLPSPANSTGSESPIFPGRHMEPPSTYGRFRRMFMEDEQGNSKISKKLQQQALSARGLEEEDFDDEDDEDDENEPPTYEIEIRSIRVGSMRTKPEGPLFINMRGVCFRVRSERTDEAFECEIMSQEVEFVKYFGGQSPVLFFLITHECGEKLREIFNMEEGGDEYLDPSSTDLKKKMVVIIVESSNYLPQDMRETLSLWADINHVDDSNFIEELTEESANDLLIQSAPAVLTADVEHDMVSFKKNYMKGEGGNLSVMPRTQSSPPGVADNEPDSTSSSPPQQTELHQYFDGPPIRLLQYPPPPARGIPITTEDLICLHEGEFLNDVIIDFYLQYLYQEKLSDDLRGRTHIFSSFFYKRLTQRDRHSEKTEEDAKKSLAERRHARVRKWTKTVDLFDKDFIIVPINENSHWYLAVVCFPGLASPEVVPYIPSTAHRGDTEGEDNDAEPPQEGTSEEKPNAQDPPVKTILGKCMDPSLCSNNDEVKYSYGQKAPCILMFDSLAGPSRNPNVKMLRDYLQCEWNAKKTEARMINKLLRGSTPKVPQQSNFSDCGVYLLQYVESFFEDPIADFQVPMKGLQQWFSEKLIMTKRKEIHELIMRLHRRFQEERGDPKILDIKYESGFPREEPPPPFPHPDQQHPNQEQHPHHHPHHHLPHPGMPPPPQDEQHWQVHPGYQDAPDPFAHGHEGEMDGGYMDSGDSSNSNSGSMADMEEQNFLYLSSQESQQNEEQQTSFGQGNLPCSKSSHSEMEDQNQSTNSGGNVDDANNQNILSEHLLDFLSQPVPTAEQQKNEDENIEQVPNSLPVSDLRMESDENTTVNPTKETNSTSLSENNADKQETLKQSVDNSSSQETQ